MNLIASSLLCAGDANCIQLGSATAKVGDPTGRTSDRPSMTPTERKANTASLHYQLKRLWSNVDRLARTHGFVPEKSWRRGLNNNQMWWGKVTVMDLLRVLGNGMRLGPMLGRDKYVLQRDLQR